VVDTIKTRKSLKKVSSASLVINGHAKNVVISQSRGISQTAHNTGRTRANEKQFAA
jgi:hypothetical protein